jgi:hypothetical protein
VVVVGLGLGGAGGEELQGRVAGDAVSAQDSGGLGLRRFTRQL